MFQLAFYGEKRLFLSLVACAYVAPVSPASGETFEEEVGRVDRVGSRLVFQALLQQPSAKIYAISSFSLDTAL